MSTLKEQIVVLAKLLYKQKGVYDGNVTFDFMSYEDINDIPKINVDGREILISNFYVNDNGDLIELTDDFDNVYTINIKAYSEYELKEIGIDTLIYDVYYETDYSYVKDFEDFLNETLA
jgi:hypothetical protein